MTHASLFSGIGGFDLAAEWAGWTNLFNCEISDWNTVDCSRYDVDPETVGQFTGLFDKNGKEIFEGDVITNDEIHTRAIEWNDYECKFNAVEWGIHKAVVLGNIHDNPELLKNE